MVTIGVALDARQAEAGARQLDAALRRLEQRLGIFERETKDSSRDVDRLGRELTSTGRRARTASGRLDRAAHSIDRLGRESLQARAGLSSLGSILAQSTSRLGRFVSGLAAVGGISFGFSKAVETITSFSDAVATLRAITGLDKTSKELEKLLDTAEELGRKTRFSATEAVQALTTLARAGLDAAESIDAIGPILNLAVLESLDLAEAARLVTTTLNQFRLESEQTAEAVDLLFAAAKLADTTITELGEALEFVGSDARGMNVSLTETLAVLDLLASRGRRASMAGTALRSILVSLGTSGSKEAQATLERMGLTLRDVNPQVVGLTRALDNFALGLGRLPSDLDRTQALVTIFGERFAGAAREVVEGRKEIESFIEKLGTLKGESADAAEEIENSLGGAYRKLKSSLEGFIIELDKSTGFSETLAAGLEGVADAVAHVSDEIKELNEEIANIPKLPTKEGPTVKDFFGIKDLSEAAAPQKALEEFEKREDERVRKMFEEGLIRKGAPTPQPLGEPTPPRKETGLPFRVEELPLPPSPNPPIPGLGPVTEKVKADFEQAINEALARQTVRRPPVPQRQPQKQAAETTAAVKEQEIAERGINKELQKRLELQQEALRNAAESVQMIQLEADMAGLSASRRREILELMRIEQGLRRAGIEDEQKIAEVLERAKEAQEARAEAQRKAEIAGTLSRETAGAIEGLVFGERPDPQRIARSLFSTIITKPLEEKLNEVFAKALGLKTDPKQIQTPKVDIQAGSVSVAGAGSGPSTAAQAATAAGGGAPPAIPTAATAPNVAPGVTLPSSSFQQSIQPQGEQPLIFPASETEALGQAATNANFNTQAVTAAGGQAAAFAGQAASVSGNQQLGQIAGILGITASGAQLGGTVAGFFGGSAGAGAGAAAGGAAAGGAAAGAAAGAGAAAAGAGAAAGGAATGAATGAAAGSVVPGIGTAIGALVGLLLGLFAAGSFRRGAAFHRGRILPYAQGGIVEDPLFFPLEEGLGLMGESGPEAILPLERDRQGRLGVRSRGGGGGVVVVNNFTVHARDADSFRRSQQQIEEDQKRAAKRFA